MFADRIRPNFCQECAAFRAGARVALLWEEFKPHPFDPEELRAGLREERGWVSLRGRGGRRRELERSAPRRGAGRPTAPIDPAAVAAGVALVRRWLEHLPEGPDARARHVAAAGLADLARVVTGRLGTLAQARQIVAHVLGVSAKTVARRLAPDLVKAARVRQAMGLRVLEAVLGRGKTQATVRRGAESVTVTLFEAPAGYVSARSLRAGNAEGLADRNH